jgi:hypothetical protein
MSTIAVHRESGTKYVVLGGDLRMFTPSHPIPTATRNESPKPIHVSMTMVCDSEGAISWFRSEELIVVEIDGTPPLSLLTTAVYR